MSETTKTQAFVRVMRNPHRTADRPWLVFCDICSQGLWFAFHPLGWARTWQTAQDYATKHAAEHRDAACPCCGHMKPIKGEAK